MTVCWIHSICLSFTVKPRTQHSTPNVISPALRWRGRMTFLNLLATLLLIVSHLAMTLASSLTSHRCIPSGSKILCISSLFKCFLTLSYSTETKSSLNQTLPLASGAWESWWDSPSGKKKKRIREKGSVSLIFVIVFVTCRCPFCCTCLARINTWLVLAFLNLHVHSQDSVSLFLPGHLTTFLPHVCFLFMLEFSQVFIHPCRHVATFAWIVGLWDGPFLSIMYKNKRTYKYLFPYNFRDVFLKS